MIIKNDDMNCRDVAKDATVDGEKLRLTVTYRLNPKQPAYSGWFASIVVLGEEEEPEWGFCSGWRPSYTEAIAALKAHVAYERYPFPI